MYERIPVRKSEVLDIMKATYPEYKGRKFNVIIQESYHFDNYWSGGSKEYFQVAKNIDGKWIAIPAPVETTNPFNKIAHESFIIPSDCMVIAHSIFCGKDMGLRFIVSPDSIYLPKLLPQ